MAWIDLERLILGLMLGSIPLPLTLATEAPKAVVNDLATPSTSASDLLPEAADNRTELEQDDIPGITQASKTEANQTSEASESQPGKLSLLDAAPFLLNLLHKNPYPFGGVGSVSGDFSSRTQITGDWGGARSALAEEGVFIGIYSTTDLQGIVDGGRRSRDDLGITQNLDLALTLDTGRLGLWSAGLIQVSLQSRFGNGISDDAGALLPTNFATEVPISDDGSYILPTEYYLLQALAPNLQVILGKTNTVGAGDANVFAGDYRYQFQNTGLVLNPMLGTYVPVSTWVAALSWQPTSSLSLSTSVLDPNGSADNFADDFFEDVSITQELTWSYQIQQRPGNLRLGWAFTTNDTPDLTDPVNFTRTGTDILDFRVSFNENNSALMFYGNFDQYLFTVNSQPTESDADSSEQPIFLNPRGLGIFGRFGIGSGEDNLIDLFGSFGLGAKGIIPGREYDELGIGWYYARVSDDFNDFIESSPILNRLLPSGVDAENGIEAYYNFAITPAINTVFNVQYIFEPALTVEDEVFILSGRLQLNF
ncbi:MAG TPA: carbohydrate porin [Xenococcaceae cyanobacterium]